MRFMETSPAQVRPGITEYDGGTWRIKLLDGSTITGKVVEDRNNHFGPEAVFFFLMDVKSGTVFGSTRLVLVRSTNMNDRYKLTA